MPHRRSRPGCRGPGSDWWVPSTGRGPGTVNGTWRHTGRGPGNRTGRGTDPEPSGVEMVEGQQVGQGVEGGEGGAQGEAPFEQGVAVVAAAQLHHRGVDLGHGDLRRLAVDHPLIEAGPLDGGPGLPHDPLLQQPGQEGGGQPGRGHPHHVAVGRFQPELDRQAEVQLGAGALEVTALDGVGLHGVEHGPGHSALGRDVDELRLLGPQHALVGHQGRHRRLGSGVAPHLGHRHLHRGPLRGALEPDRPAQGPDRQLGGGLGGPRSVGPERGDQDQDQAGVGRRQLSGGEAQRRQAPRRTGIEHQVAGGYQGQHQGPVGHRVAGQHHLFFGRVVGQVPEPVGSTVGAGAPGGALHPDHGGPQIGQDVGTHLTPVVGEVQDVPTGEHGAPVWVGPARCRQSEPGPGRPGPVNGRGSGPAATVPP